TSLTPIWRIASTMVWPCETRTSTCRNFATISSGLYRFLAITVLLDVKDIPQVGPLQWGRITMNPPINASSCVRRSRNHCNLLGIYSPRCSENYEECIGAKKHLVLSLLPQSG